ncbi:MAG: hypothetical protein FWD75_07935, partial [Propionibacteriaceae bacterium]|nr:hypothetical protein [Propionibacteriaceae bacterium]
MSVLSRHGKKWIAGLSAFALAAGAVVGLVTPVASAQVIPPTSTTVALNMKVNGDRTGATANGVLAGVTVALSGSPEITCVSDADGDCTLLVPTSMTSTSASTRFTAEVVSAPDGWYDTTYPGTVTWLVPAGPAGGLSYSSSQPIVMARTNPPVVCGQDRLKVAMMVDLSGSMATNNAIDVLKRDAKGYVSALAGTNASIALFTFSSKSPANGSTNVNRPLTPVDTQADVDRLNGWIDGWVTADGTNWDDAFWTVAQDPTVFNVLIFITDGMPMTSRNPVPNSLFGAFIKDDAASANAVKLQGTRIIVIAVGTDFIANDMESVSGTTVGDATDPVSNDYFMPTNWGDASKVFDALTQVCSVPTSTVEVNFTDDDTGQPVTPLPGFQTTLTGSVGDPVGFDEQAALAGYDPSLYEFVSMDDIPVYTDDPQTLTVHLKHVKVAVDVPVTHTVRYVGTPTPITDNVSTITWTMTTDQVTSSSVCTTTSTEFPAVTSPLVPTYTADQLVVPAIPVTSPSAACPPANIVDTVTYTRIPDGTVDVVFFDVDDQVPVAPVAGFQTSFAGQPGTDVGFTEDMARSGFDASKYVYVSFTNVLTFTAAPQTITVRVQHKITDLASTTTRTITYVGSGSTSIPDVVSVLHWAGTRDEATGVSVCMTSDAGYPAVTSPDVYGYTSDPAVVPAEAAVTPQVTCPTQNSTVTVTYTRIPDGTVQVVFFDVDDQVPVTPVAGFQTSFSGLPGEDVGFTEAMARSGF